MPYFSYFKLSHWTLRALGDSWAKFDPQAGVCAPLVWRLLHLRHGSPRSPRERTGFYFLYKPDALPGVLASEG